MKEIASPKTVQEMRRLQTEQTWQRIELIIEWSGLTAEQFIQGIGFWDKDGLNKIKTGETNLMRDFAKLTRRKYPELNREWILYGIGPMTGFNTECLEDLPGDKMADADVRESGNTFHIHLRLRNDVDPELFEDMVRTIGLGFRNLWER